MPEKLAIIAKKFVHLCRFYSLERVAIPSKVLRHYICLHDIKIP